MSARSIRRARDREVQRQGTRGRRARITTAVGATLGGTVLFASTAEAATFTVTKLADTDDNACNADCSLREAVYAANDAAGLDDVTFAAGLTGTITLGADGDIFVTEGVDIIGPGADVVTVSGDDNDQIFDLYGFESANEPASISGLTLRDGSALNGGALYSGPGTDEAPDLTLSNVVVTGNDAGSGGAVYHREGDLTIANSTFSGNEATSAHGGALYSDDGTLAITGSTFTGNISSDYAGAVYVRNTAGGAGDQVVIRDTAFTGNDAVGDGGGTYFASVDGNVVIARSTFADNVSEEDGGGLVVNTETGDVLISETTVSGNTATDTAGGIWLLGVEGSSRVQNSTVSANSGAFTGGIQFYSEDTAQLNLTNSTIVGNRATETDYSAGGVHLYGDDALPGAPTANISSTIIAGNTSGAGTGQDIDGGSDLDEPAQFNVGFSLIGNTTLTQGATLNPTGPNLTGVDPLLGPLANNGGPTPTHAPAFSSPVIDMGAGNGLPTDQRGAPRTFDAANFANAAGGDGTDIGAVELLPGGRLGLSQCKGRAENVLFAPGAEIVGTGGNDVVVGTAAKDVVRTKGGKDLVCAQGGNDGVKAGGGKDRAFGQGGKDRLKGQGGKDKLSGNAGRDTLKGGGGADTLKGGGGKDKLRGGPGLDKLRGGGGKDSERQ